jgi:hypothetical protein
MAQPEGLGVLKKIQRPRRELNPQPSGLLQLFRSQLCPSHYILTFRIIPFSVAIVTPALPVESSACKLRRRQWIHSQHLVYLAEGYQSQCVLKDKPNHSLQ